MILGLVRVGEMVIWKIMVDKNGVKCSVIWYFWGKIWVFVSGCV